MNRKKLVSYSIKEFPYPFMCCPFLRKEKRALIRELMVIKDPTDYKSLPCAVFHSRSKGVILNVASASGMYPVPLLTLYSSSKASSLPHVLSCSSLSHACVNSC